MKKLTNMTNKRIMLEALKEQIKSNINEYINARLTENDGGRHLGKVKQQLLERHNKLNDVLLQTIYNLKFNGER